MVNNSPKHIAFKTLLKYRRYSLNNYGDLKSIIEAEQFTIIEYKKYTNSALVSELIIRLRIEKEIGQNNCFLYISNNLRFVFINTDISDEDKCSLLRHELGHICDPDFKKSDAYYSKIKKEEFANEFSSYIKNPGIGLKIRLFIIKKWGLLAGIVALMACVLGCIYIINTTTSPATKPVTVGAPSRVNYHSIYYVTSAGKKYHRKSCIIIKYKNNLTEITLDDAVDSGYKPCMICNPQK